MPVYLSVLYLITILANLALGALAFFQNKAKTLNRIFAVFIVSVVGWQFTLYLFYTWHDHSVILFLGRLNFVFASLLATTLFFVCIHFPSSIVKIKKWITYFTIIETFLLLMLIQFSPLIIANEIIAPNLERETEFGSAYYLFVLHFIILVSMGLFSLIRKSRILTGVARVQTKYLLMGIFFSILLGAITNLFLPLFFKLYHLQSFGPLATVFVIGFTTYAIIRHRLLDIRLIVARTISYSILIIIISSSYAFLIFLLGNLIFPELMSANQFFVSISLALVIAFTFQPLTRFIEKYTDKIFYKGKYDVQEVLTEINQKMVSTYVLSELLDNSLNILVSSMRSSWGKIILFDDKSISHNSKVMGESNEVEFTFEEAVTLDKFAGDITIFDELNEGRKKEFFRSKNLAVAISLVTKKQSVGLILLGYKLSGEMYLSNDLSLIEILAPQLAIAVQNAKGIEAISNFNIVLKEEIQRATKKLSTANQRLLELDKLKDEFVSLASHELRTPMVSIRNYIWMVLNGKGGKVNPKQREYLRRAYDSTSRLSRLVNSMLNLSRIESGRVILSVEQADIRKVIRDVITELGIRSDKIGIELTLRQKVESVKTAESVQLPTVLIDVDKIKEVLVNLIGNSLKFTPAGGTISVALAVDKEEVRVEISDTGVGLDEEQIPKLFKKFSMLRESYSTNATMAQGTGLGLYISKSIIQLHGGKIWVESSGRGKGTSFYFTIPRYSEEHLHLLRKNQHNGTDAGIIHSAVTDY